MSNSNQMIPFTMETGEEYEDTNYSENTNQSEYTSHSEYTDDYILTIIVPSVCILGLVGNGIVIWLLGFCIKRNSCTTYILNLAMADFGVLLATFCQVLHVPFSVFFIQLFYVMYTAVQFLLTVIGIDRCVLVFFPIWHRCHRPPHLPIVVCTITWVSSLLVCEVPVIVNYYSEVTYFELWFFVNALLCLPLLSVSTVALFIKVYFKSHQPRWGKLLVAISLALLFFLIFAFPLNVVYILHYVNDSLYNKLFILGHLCASINSSVNPAIYFLIGRKKRSRTRESLKVILQRVFSEKDFEDIPQFRHPP